MRTTQHRADDRLAEAIHHFALNGPFAGLGIPGHEGHPAVDQLGVLDRVPNPGMPAGNAVLPMADLHDDISRRALAGVRDRELAKAIREGGLDYAPLLEHNARSLDRTIQRVHPP